MPRDIDTDTPAGTKGFLLPYPSFPHWPISTPPTPSRLTSQLGPFTTLLSSIYSCGNKGSRESGPTCFVRVAIFLASRLVLVVAEGGGTYSPVTPSQILSGNQCQIGCPLPALCPPKCPSHAAAGLTGCGTVRERSSPRSSRK